MNSIRRKRATITVTVAGKPRRFILRAHSVAQHLEQLERQQAAHEAAREEANAGRSKAAAARAGMTATLAVVLELLQEPTDGGHGLTEDEAWLLRLEDPTRVLTLQHQLTDVEGALGPPREGKAPSTADLVDEWLDIGTTIARASLAPEPHLPLNEWSMAQVIETYHRACRELWRETDFQIRLAGGKGGKEPDFVSSHRRKKSTSSRDENLKTLASWGGRSSRNVDSAPFTAEDEARYAKMKAEVESRPGRCDPDGRKFPGML